MKKTLLSAALLEVVVSGAVLLLLSFLFWKFRIFDSGVNPAIEVGPVDLYIEITPMNVYGFEALAQDRFGKGVKALNKLEASGLIEELLEKTGQNQGNARNRFQRRFQRAGGR